MQKFIEWYLDFYPTSGVPLKRRIAIHITFWVVWGLLNFMAFISEQSLEDKLIRTLFVLIQGSVVYYGIFYFAIPNLLSSRRFVIGLLILFLIYVFNYLESLIFYELGLKYNYFQLNSSTYKYAQIYVGKGLRGIFTPTNIFFEILMALSNVTFLFMLKLSRIITDYSIRVARLTKEKTDLEIDFLRSQLNPHFLLNSLNNIYSKVMSNDETAGDSIVILSDMMKYILYHSGEVLVDLDREIHFLRDYVDLEKLRGGRNLIIKFSQEGNMKGYDIAPLILINYVENAFKHGGSTRDKVSLIDINIKFINETLHFRIENDFVEKIKNDKQVKEGGVGITNTSKRLKLLYPNRHSLTIRNDNNKFCVEIMIALQKA